jgi:ubiquinone/menaquinone biosynthesis C-methylase UbiE
VNSDTPTAAVQKKFDFAAPRPRPFLSNLPARIDTYEEGVADFFHWWTGLNYYATIDQIVDFVINTHKLKVFDFQTDTGTFALRLAGRKAFGGKVSSYDSNITLLERARQRAEHQKLDRTIDFRQYAGGRFAVADASAEIAVSIFDFHRHYAEGFLEEAYRLLCQDGHLLIAEMIEPGTSWNSWFSFWRKIYSKYKRKNSSEADGIYYDKEQIIRMLFDAGFRQVIIQGLKEPSSPHKGVFSLIAATK